jgi:choline kinase
VQTPISIVISAAGFGTRMDLGIPKSLIQINGRSFIEHQLKLIEKSYELILVVGFKAELVAREAWNTRSDAIVVINHRFQNTGTASSLSLGAQISTERLVGFDGDILLSKACLDKFLSTNENLIGIMPISSHDAHKVKLENDLVLEFDTLEYSNWEWTGPVNISRHDCRNIGEGHVYQGISRLLPMKAIILDGVELDYPSDILRCEEWLDNQIGIK